jgi:hypothetical protein
VRSLAVGAWPFAVALLAACASAPPPPPPPSLTVIPHTVLDALCTRLHDEGVSSDTALNVVNATQPLVTPTAIHGLAEAAFWDKPYDAVALSETASRDAAPLPVEVPHGGCAWRAIDQNAVHSADVMTLEVSPPFRNPFGHEAYGILARVSLARQSATWYWVPLGAMNGRWAVGKPMLLAMR